MLAKFIGRAIYDGTVTYKYLTDAEISSYDSAEESQKEEEILHMILNMISVKPLYYHMRNIWSVAYTNDEYIIKFKSMIGDYLIESNIEELGQYMREIKGFYYYHEFVKNAIL